jgi:hypothetical protein
MGRALKTVGCVVLGAALGAYAGYLLALGVMALLRVELTDALLSTVGGAAGFLGLLLGTRLGVTVARRWASTPQ